MLDAKSHQGKFGEDYVRVLASAAGLLISKLDLDRDGVDLGLHWQGRLGPAASPAIEVQVKSWSNPRQSGDCWNYNGLDEKQFNLIAGDGYTVPRYLFLILVPKAADAYADVITDGMLLRYQGFYVSLRDEPLIAQPDGNRHRTVRVPIGNVLTAKTLLGLIHPDLGGHGVPRTGGER